MISIKQLTSEYLDDLSNINSVLDLGCGPGRKSLRFAKKGIKVTGIDRNEIKITQDNFTFIQKEMKDFQFKESYDLIIASLVLHFMKNKKAIETIQKIKKNTKANGYNFIICISDQDGFAKERKEKFYPTQKELKELYPESEWDIKKCIQDFTDYEEHGDIPRHRHNLIFLLIQKDTIPKTKIRVIRG